MNEIHELFTVGESLVVNIKNDEELKRLLNKCHTALGINKDHITFFRRFKLKDLQYSAGIKRIADGNVCIEYDPYRGFTAGDRKHYEKYGITVVPLEDFLK